MLHLAISPCPNDTFAFFDLLHYSPFKDDIELTIADIDELNDILLEDKADFCKASVYAYAKKRNGYSILPSGSALGQACGPLIISKRPIEITPESSIAIPGKLTTANLLCSLAYPQITQKKILPFDKIISAVERKEVDLGLIIHESRFVYQERNLHCMIDLGEWWEKKTKSLIPLGIIAANRQLPKKLVDAFNQSLYYSIEQAQNPNYEHREELLNFVKSYAQETEQKIIDKHIQTYVNQQTLRLDKQGVQAIEKLSKEAVKRKLASPSSTPLIR